MADPRAPDPDRSYYVEHLGTAAFAETRSERVTGSPDADDPLRVLFVCGADLAAPSEKQALWFAREISRRGHSAMLSLSGDPATARESGGLGGGEPQLIWHSFLGPRVRAGAVGSAARFRPDLIHAWNARRATLAVASAYRRATGAPVLVHWEDDEWWLMRAMERQSRPRRLMRGLRRAGSRLSPRVWHFATSRSLAWATREAVSFDAVTPALAEEIARRTGRACATLLPASPREAWGSDGAAPALPPAAERGEVLLFTGDIHPGRERDIRLCLEAIAAVQRKGIRAVFVHAGRNSFGTGAGELGSQAGLGPGTAVELGVLPFAQIPPLLRRARILVEPGAPSSFNRFRLPSKLQAYLASGTPVITFAVGAGELLRDREEVLKTYTDSPGELADRIVELLGDEPLRRTLSAGGPRAARRLFDPVRNTDALVAHYRDSLRSRTHRGSGRAQSSASR